MIIENSFDIDADPDRVFEFLQDAHNVAACFPGAELVEDLGDDSYKGKVKIKLGPVTAAFSGVAKIIERDAEKRVAVLVAEGKDARGSGTAKAKASMRVEPSATGGASVLLETDLTISGKLAQFGRGIMADVSERMVGELAARVRQRIEADQPVTAAAAAPAGAPADRPAGGPSAASPRSEPTGGPATTAEPASPPPAAAAAPARPAARVAAPADTDSTIKASAILKVVIAGMFRRLFDRLRGRAHDVSGRG